MPPGFQQTKLAKDEAIVIGPIQLSSSFSVQGGQPGQQAQKVNITVIGITNQRVIVEDVDTPRNTKFVKNADVKRVWVKRTGRGSKLEKVQTASGQTLNVGLGWLNPMQEAMLFKLFPNAEIGKKKGIFGGFAKLAPMAAPTGLRPGPGPGKRPPPRRAAPRKPKSGFKPQPAAPATGRSHISDPEVKGPDDLRRLYPLPEDYDYIEEKGNLRVKRLSDGLTFPILAEEGLLGFDIPVYDNPKRRKKTIEIFRDPPL